MSHIAYAKLQGFEGPIGSATKKMAALATSAACPFVYACHWLSLFSLVDDSILAIEDKVETLFPPSTHVFDKLDDLLRVAETLPGKFDDAAGKLPLIIQRVPLLNWVLTYVVSWLNFFLSVLVHVGSDAARQKDIMVDKNCNEPKMHQTELSGKSGEDAMKSPTEVLKCTYKEALKKGTNKDEKNMKEDDCEEIVKTMEKKEVGVSKENEEENGVEGEKNASKVGEGEGEGNDEPILEFFETGWHMKTGIGAVSPSQSQSNLEELAV